MIITTERIELEKYFSWSGKLQKDRRKMREKRRSTVRIEVGHYKSGEKRYEIRHFNDLKIAHPDSLAAPAVRPALGRPSKIRSDQTEVQIQTEAQAQAEQHGKWPQAR